MAESRISKIIWALFGFVGGVFILMAQTPAREAISNIETWLNLLGINTKEYNFENIDIIITIIGAVVLGISLIFLYRIIANKKKILLMYTIGFIFIGIGIFIVINTYRISTQLKQEIKPPVLPKETIQKEESKETAPVIRRGIVVSGGKDNVFHGGTIEGFDEGISVTGGEGTKFENFKIKEKPQNNINPDEVKEKIKSWLINNHNKFSEPPFKNSTFHFLVEDIPNSKISVYNLNTENPGIVRIETEMVFAGKLYALYQKQSDIKKHEHRSAIEKELLHFNVAYFYKLIDEGILIGIQKIFTYKNTSGEKEFIDDLFLVQRASRATLETANNEFLKLSSDK